jgi:transposase-like protein
MATSYKRGISSYQVARNLGVTQKTAWFMMQRIRKLFEQLKAGELQGLCAADETYVGGKAKNKHVKKRVKGQSWRGKSEKINVFGVMQVGGHVITKTVTDVSSKTLKSLLLNYVKPGSTVMTDEWLGYNGIESHFKREICQHAMYEYVSDTGATTNPIENYWSHVKRAVIGTYYKMTRKHIHRYLAEFDFKFNYRSLHDGEKFNLVLAQAHNTRLTYRQLINK